MNDIHTLENLLTLKILPYDKDNNDGNIVGELARRTVQIFENSVRLLRYNNHICYVNNINAVFQSFCCPNCDTFFNRTFNLERQLTTCSEWVKNVYPRNVYQIQETLFDKLDSFGIKYTSEQKIFKNLAIFDFESICVQEEIFKDTNTTNRNGEQIPISVSISSNLVEEPILLSNSDPHHLVTSFIGALENLALQSKTIMKNLFFDIKTTLKIKLGSILEKLTQRQNRREQTDLDDSDNEICTSTQFLQIQKKQLIDLQEHLECFCKVLPIFGFNSAKYDLNLMKSCLLPIFVNERNIEPTVIKKANQFISFNFGDIQLLDIMNFFGGSTVLIPSWRHTKLQRKMDSSPTNGLITPRKCRILNFPGTRMMLSTVNFAAATLSKPNTQTMLTYWKLDWPQNKPLSNWNCRSHPLLELRNIITRNRYGSKNKWVHPRTFCGGITTKMLCQLWRQCKKWLPFTTTKISICWSLVVHYQTWLTFAYRNLLTQTFVPSQRVIKTYWKKNREDVVGGSSIVFTRKAVVYETFIRKSRNICKSFVGVDASQLYPYSMCQPLAHLNALGYRFRNQ